MGVGRVNQHSDRLGRNVSHKYYLGVFYSIVTIVLCCKDGRYSS